LLPPAEQKKPEVLKLPAFGSVTVVGSPLPGTPLQDYFFGNALVPA